MKSQITAAFGARRAANQATSERWLQLSLVVGLLAVALVLPAVAVAADTPAEKQLDFGADMARRGLWKEALFRFQQADRLDPNNSRILNNIAVSFEALGLFDEALEVYRKALQVGPGDEELKGNYSRFVEFYQSFRPREETGETEADAVTFGDEPTAEEAAE